MQQLNSKVVGFRLANVVEIDRFPLGNAVDEAANSAPGPSDVDLRFVRVDRREEGTWDSITRKISFPSNQGQKKLYFVIGFGTVCDNHGGTLKCIERPLEFFVPVGQSDADYQWISSNMRLLSLAARGGFLAKALEDMRQVQSGEAIWFGKTAKGKTLVHTSSVAVLAWSIQEELRLRGYFNEKFEEIDLDTLIARYERNKAFREGGQVPVSTPIIVTSKAEDPTEPVASTQAVRCPERGCGGSLVLASGCPTCVDCGWSKCG